MTDSKNKKFWIIAIIVLIAALSRLLPHPENFTPIVAMALFSGAYFVNKRFAVIFAMAALFLSDLILNNTLLRSFYPDTEGLVIFSEYMLWVYGSMFLIVLIGVFLLKKINGIRVLGGAIGASVLFYLITNTGAMIYDPVYTKDLAGWGASMTAGLPFFKNALLGNVIYSVLLFGGYEWVSRLATKRSIA